MSREICKFICKVGFYLPEEKFQLKKMNFQKSCVICIPYKVTQKHLCFPNTSKTENSGGTKLFKYHNQVSALNSVNFQTVPFLLNAIYRVKYVV